MGLTTLTCLSTVVTNRRGWAIRVGDVAGLPGRFTSGAECRRVRGRGLLAGLAPKAPSHPPISCASSGLLTGMSDGVIRRARRGGFATRFSLTAGRLGLNWSAEAPSSGSVIRRASAALLGLARGRRCFVVVVGVGVGCVPCSWEAVAVIVVVVVVVVAAAGLSAASPLGVTKPSVRTFEPSGLTLTRRCPALALSKLPARLA